MLQCKETTCQSRRCRFDPWVGKIPWRRKWQRSLVFLPGESHGQRSLEGYSPWGCNRFGHDWVTKNKIGKRGYSWPWEEPGRSPSRASWGGAQGINLVQILSPETDSTMWGLGLSNQTQPLWPAGNKRSILAGTEWGGGCRPSRHLWGQPDCGWEMNIRLGSQPRTFSLASLDVCFQKSTNTPGSRWKGASAPSVTIKYGISNFIPQMTVLRRCVPEQ